MPCKEDALRQMPRIRPNPLLGQRFLVSSAVLAKIIESAKLSSDDTLLEIGPGTGILTFELARRAREVIAVEKDSRLAAALAGELERRGITNVRLILGDILKIPLEKLVVHPPRSWEKYNKPKVRERGAVRYRVVANIPYYLTSRLIRVLLEAEHPPSDILLMVQKEVAERIVARPPKMNLLALSVQAYGRAEIICRVPASAFSPRPRVDSALIKISDISTAFFHKHHISPHAFFALTRAGFSQKRKTLANSLARPYGGKPQTLKLIRAAGLGQSARAQELSLAAWARLARHMPGLGQ